MKRWVIAVAAVGLAVGIAGPVAAKSGSAKVAKPAKAVVVAAPKSSAPVTVAAPVLPKHHGGGGYPGVDRARVQLDPSSPRPGRSFKVKVEYFCKRGTVTVTLDPTASGWPKTITTDRYGKGYVTVSGGLPKGSYSVTATCDAYTATKSFRVR